MPFCPKCGTQNYEGAQVCQQCQSPMPGARPSGGQPNAGAHPYNPGGYSPQPPQPYQPFGGNMPQPNYGYAPAPAMAGQYASVGKRIAAALLDGLIGMAAQIPGWIVYGIAIAVGVSSADANGQIHDAGAFIGLMFLSIGLMVLGGLGVALYNIYLLGKTGSTLGKRWMKIKVLDPAGQPLGFGKALMRELVKGFIGSCFILLLWPLWDQEKQGLYDKLFSTHVYNA